MCVCRARSPLFGDVLFAGKCPADTVRSRGVPLQPQGPRSRTGWSLRAGAGWGHTSCVQRPGDSCWPPPRNPACGSRAHSICSWGDVLGGLHEPFPGETWCLDSSLKSLDVLRAEQYCAGHCSSLDPGSVPASWGRGPHLPGSVAGKKQGSCGPARCTAVRVEISRGAGGLVVTVRNSAALCGRNQLVLPQAGPRLAVLLSGRQELSLPTTMTTLRHCLGEPRH